jgi:hypothetical protein
MYCVHTYLDENLSKPNQLPTDQLQGSVGLNTSPLDELAGPVLTVVTA